MSDTPSPTTEQQVPNRGGGVLAAPEVVTVTWENDPLDADLEAFDRWYVASDAWTSALAEYGVGRGSYGGHTRLPGPAPATVSEISLESAWEQGVIPPPNDNRVFLVYPPIADACDTFAPSTHARTSFGQSAAIAYLVVIPRCAALNGLTTTASLGLANTATDPDPSRGAWLSYDVGEIGDLCAGQSTVVEGHHIGLLWSNAAAAASARPCVPAPPGPMFGIYAPSDEVTVGIGQQATITIRAFATGAYPPFAVGAYGNNPDFTVSLSASTASDGDSLELTISGAGNEEAEITLLATGIDYLTEHAVKVNPQR